MIFAVLNNMKKVYLSKKYKRYQRRRARREARSRKARLNNVHVQLNYSDRDNLGYQSKSGNKEYPSIDAPTDFRLLDNTTECSAFFRKLRSKQNVSRKNYRKYKIVSLIGVETIDFPAALTLSAICKELRYLNINVQGDLPTNEQCRDFLVDSGFLEDKYDMNGKMYHLTSKTKSMAFEQGQGKLLIKDLKNIASLTKSITDYLEGDVDNPNYNLPQLLKEICANSSEWSDSYKRQWTLAVKFEENKVVVSTIDLGQGILKSLERRHKDIIMDLLTLKSRVDILAGAFDKKYGSKSKDINRNKGLPSLKFASQQGLINKLIVITNNVLLSFDKWHDNCTFAMSTDAFNGTMYYFEIDKNCLK